MASPLYPSLIPRYVDESWFVSDQPVDEAAKLNELEANHEVWVREAHYRNVDIHNHLPIEDDGIEDDDDEAINEDDEEDDDDIEEADDVDDEYMPNVMPSA